MKNITLTEKVKFLSAVSAGKSITQACEISGIPRRTVYYWRKEDVDFADAWEEALEAQLHTAEDELWERAMDRSDAKSAMLLVFLLKKLNPEYRENHKAEGSRTATPAQEFDFTPDEVDTALAILNAAKTKKSDPII